MDRKLIVVLAPSVLLAPALHANAGWQAIYITFGYVMFWYVVLPSLLVEFIVIRVFLEPNWKRALGITLAGNAMSFVVGGVIASFFGAFIPMSYSLLSFTITLIWVFLFTWIVEVLSISLWFKFKIRQVAAPLAVANVLTHVFYIVLVLAE